MKRTHLLPLILLAAILLSACAGRPAAPVRTASAEETDAAVLHVNVHPQGRETKALDALLPGFQEQLPEYRVVRGHEPTQNVAAAAMRSGRIHLGWSWYWYPWANETYLDLRHYVQRDKVDLASIGFGAGKEPAVYTLPCAMWPIGFLYDQAAFKAAGIPKPQKGWTWEDFRATAKALTRQVDGETVYGYGRVQVEYLVRMYVEGKTGSLELADEETVAEAIDFFRTMIYTDGSLMQPKYRYWGRNPWYHSTFDEGLFATTVHLYSPGIAAQVGESWRWGPLPAHPGKEPVGLAIIFGWNASVQAPDPEAAWKFIKYSASEDGAKALAAAGMTPVLLTPEVRKVWLETHAAEPGAEAILDTQWHGPLLIQESGARHNELAAALHQAANAVLAEGASMEVALEQYRKDRIRILRLAQ